MPRERQLPKPAENFSLDRYKALADGVIAIVVTLLVPGIDVPSDHRFYEEGLMAFLAHIGFDLVWTNGAQV